MKLKKKPWMAISTIFTGLALSALMLGNAQATDPANNLPGLLAAMIDTAENIERFAPRDTVNPSAFVIVVQSSSTAVAPSLGDNRLTMQSCPACHTVMPATTCDTPAPTMKPAIFDGDTDRGPKVIMVQTWTDDEADNRNPAGPTWQQHDMAQAVLAQNVIP